VVIRREDAERFIEEVRGDDPEVAEKLRIEERERDGRNQLDPSLVLVDARPCRHGVRLVHLTTGERSD